MTAKVKTISNINFFTVTSKSAYSNSDIIIAEKLTQGTIFFRVMIKS